MPAIEAKRFLFRVGIAAIPVLSEILPGCMKPVPRPAFAAETSARQTIQEQTFQDETPPIPSPRIPGESTAIACSDSDVDELGGRTITIDVRTERLQASLLSENHVFQEWRAQYPHLPVLLKTYDSDQRGSVRTVFDREVPDLSAEPNTESELNAGDELTFRNLLEIIRVTHGGIIVEQWAIRSATWFLPCEGGNDASHRFAQVNYQQPPDAFHAITRL